MDIAWENRLNDVRRFYDLLAKLEKKCGGKRLLKDCHGRMDWPERGVYFFFEPGEMRSTSGDEQRVVRVGTVALKEGSNATLWKRLSQHQGTQKSGGGNHRGSVFRLHIGTALMNRDNWPEAIKETWGKGSNASKSVRQVEHEFEKKVSQYIRKMPFLWLEVADPPGPTSQRKYIERNSIALLSNFCDPDTPIDTPNQDWLGQYASSEEVRRCGLWNANHTRECYDPVLFKHLEQLIF